MKPLWTNLSVLSNKHTTAICFGLFKRGQRAEIQASSLILGGFFFEFFEVKLLSQPGYLLLALRNAMVFPASRVLLMISGEYKDPFGSWLVSEFIIRVKVRFIIS